MQTNEYADPARTIIDKCGGVHAVAAITGRDVTRVYRWMYPRDKGGSDGEIPHSAVRKLLDHAARNGIDLRPDDFFPAAAQQVAGASVRGIEQQD